MKIIKCKRAVLIVLLLTSIHAFAQVQCTIIGEVINRGNKALLIRPSGSSHKVFTNNPVRIPIENGKFEYTFTYSEIQAYELAFEEDVKKGAYRTIPFFPLNGTVQFKLYADSEWNSNTVTGGELNAQFASYEATLRNIVEKPSREINEVRNTLRKNDEFETTEYKEVIQQLKAIKSGDHDALVPVYQKMDEMEKTQTRYTEKAKRLFLDRSDSLNNAMTQWKYDYIKKNISLMSYYVMMVDADMRIKGHALTARLVSETFPTYEKKYPGHIYTKNISTQLAALRTIMPGNRYIDVKAPTLSGEVVQLSEIITNHVTLIDLWGSWCGPCIAKSRQVVPIYNQYKDKGFTVVGIAREFRNTDALKSRLGKEQFSWPNLVELDDKQNIWNTYGIGNGAGLMVLVDKQGIILAVDPKVEEIEKILRVKLN